MIQTLPPRRRPRPSYFTIQAVLIASVIAWLAAIALGLFAAERLVQWLLK